MSRAIEQAVGFTHNTRLNYRTKIVAELKIEQDQAEPKDWKIVLPTSIPTEQLDRYKKGMTIFILGEEIVTSVPYGIDDNSKLQYWADAEGIKTFIVRDFVGSTANGGYFKIKDVTNTSQEKSITLEGDGFIEEEWIGIICLSAWREDSTILKPINEYLLSNLAGSGIVSERVKNYGYQLASGGSKVDKKTGMPKDLLVALRRFKKLPEVYNHQIKELIYV